MNEYDQDKKAKIIPNSEINNEIKEDKSDFEDDFLFYYSKGVSV